MTDSGSFRTLTRCWATVTALVTAVGITAGVAPAYAAPAPTPTPMQAPAPGPDVTVILTCAPGMTGPVAAAVTLAGGTVRNRLTATDTVIARVPAAAVPGLRTVSGVQAITGDAKVTMAGSKWKPGGDPFSMYKVNTISGAIYAFNKLDSTKRKITGKGIGVALIDSGISPVMGLGNAGQVIDGPDLSFESQAPNLTHLDTFGHGTHMAAIIAGRDPLVKPDREDDAADFVGMAPDSHLVNVKVASSDGAVDVSQVLAGIDWVVTHRNDPGMAIRVLNLSFGTDSVQDERLDPLSHAVESAWRKGIVVVVSAGNAGVNTGRLTMPAVNPYVIAVGAADSNGTDAKTDDLIEDFSSGGNATRHPDLLALGRSIASLRVRNSYVDVNYPSALIPVDPDQRYFRGSGTSQAAAVVSGAVALLLQQRPTLTPDQVKLLLTSTATKLDATVQPLKQNPMAQGAGEMDLAKAIDAPTPTAAAAAQSWPASAGTGSLEASRGTAIVADPVNGVELHGERDIQGQAWNGTGWAQRAAAGTAWTGNTWNGRTWAGSAWSGNAWSGAAWAGRSWASSTWLNGSWTGRSWAGRSWAGKAWADSTWAASYWR